MASIDFGRHSDDYAAYRPGLPPSFFERLDRFLPIASSRAVDLGTGPGLVALELAARGSHVVGIDVAPPQIAAAERAARARQLDRSVTFAVGRAEATGLEAGAYDLVTAVQCWHWFDAAEAFSEVRRVLRPGGLLALVSYAYVVEVSAVARESEELILRFNPSWTMAGSTGTHARWVQDVTRGGLRFVEAFSYDHDEAFSHERWRGRMRTCNGVGSGGLPPEGVGRFDVALASMLAARFPEPMTIPHRIWCVIARSE